MTFTVTVLGPKDSGDVSVFERLGKDDGTDASLRGKRNCASKIIIDSVEHDVDFYNFSQYRDLSHRKTRDESDFLILCITQKWLESLALISQEDLVLKFNEITPLLPNPSDSPSLKKLLIVVKISDEKKSEYDDEQESNQISADAATGLGYLRERLSRRNNLSLLSETIYATETGYSEIREIKDSISEAIKSQEVTKETDPSQQTDETKTRKSYFPYKVASAGFALTSLGCTSFALFGTATPIATFLGASTFTILTIAGAGLTGVLAVVFFVAAAYLLHKQSVNEKSNGEESAHLLSAQGT